MPQQSLIPRDNNGSPADRVTICETAPSRPEATGTAPVTTYLNDLNEMKCASRRQPFAEDRMTLAFQHLDVVLAIAARGPGQAGSGEARTSLNARRLRAESVPQQEGGVAMRVADATSHIEGVRNAPAAGNPEDPVIRRLSDALAATERSDDRYTGVCADALRLAIVTRMLGLRSETQLPRSGPTRPVMAVSNGRCGRCRSGVSSGSSKTSTTISRARSRFSILLRSLG